MRLNKLILEELIKEVITESTNNDDTIRLYRGLEDKLNKDHDLAQTDAMYGYSTWTDSAELAREYAGDEGFIYYIDLPKSEEGDNAIDENPNSETYGDRVLFFFNDKKAGLHGVDGKEVLVYNDHELYDDITINEVQ